MKIVVIGGTGLVGSKTVAILREGGHEVVAASPKSGINTITGGPQLAASDTMSRYPSLELTGPTMAIFAPRSPKRN